MATITGVAIPSSGNAGRIPYVDVVVSSRSSSQAVVTYTVRSSPTGGYGTSGTFSGTLTVNGTKYAVSGPVPANVAGTIKQFSVTYKQGAAFTLAVSLSGGVPGTSGWASTSLSGSVSVPAGGSAPGAPTGFSLQRTGEKTATITFTKGSGATSTQITASKNGAAWYPLGNPIGTSQPVQGLTLDSWWRFAMYSKNAAGNSGTTGVPTYPMYTTPKTPGTPVLGDSRKVSWTLPARYKHGVQIAYRDTGVGDGTVVDLGAVTSWTDPDTQPPTRQYRVRCWAGPSIDEARTYSEWSDWSATAMGVTYKPPAVTKLEAYRCDSAGVRTETGTYIRVVSSGTVSSVKNGSTETNKVTRKVAYRQVGTSTWNETTIVQNATPANWTLAAVTIGGGLILETQAWEVRYTVVDAYTTTPIQALTQVPTSTVALSLAGRGAGVGKTWQRGALDVGGDTYIEGNLHLADPNIITINGTAYERTGTVACTTPSWSGVQGSYVGSTPFNKPYEPPTGWGFVIWPYLSNAYLNCRLNDSQTTILAYAYNNNATLTRVAWLLVKTT